MTAPLRSRIPQLLGLVKARAEYLSMNAALFTIFRGNLLEFVDDALKKQLSGQSYLSARQRIAPINVMRRMVDKQSKIYSQGVRRSVENGNETDAQLLAFLETSMKSTQKMQTSNEYFNLFKNTLIQPFLSRSGLPSIRSIPSDRFVAYSTDRDEDETPTGFVLDYGTMAGKKKGASVRVYLAMEALEFCFFTDEEVDVTKVFQPNNPTGVNGFGQIPLVYINRDTTECMPMQDTDMFSMSVLIPLLFTDVNFAHMFQAFSILYGINVTDKGLVFSPNAFWQFETDPSKPEQKPEIGQITPKADISGGLELIAAQFSLWLNTRGIKAGAVGDVNAANFTSGIAKIMDEMDTSEDRNTQIPFFRDGEVELWDLSLNKMLPHWQLQPSYKGMGGRFSPGAFVTVNFAEQVPLVRRGAVVAEQKTEVEAGFTTSRRAIKAINPTMTDNEVDQLIGEIKAEKDANKPAPTPPPVVPDEEGAA